MDSKKYIVIATDDVEDDLEDDLDRYVSYLLYEKKNEQSARNVIDDY